MKIRLRWEHTEEFDATVEVPDDFDVNDGLALGDLAAELEGDDANYTGTPDREVWDAEVVG